ncbi:hemerythrin domain-containing protein [Antarcticibacterium arcticum]|uniref:hemerythrin domain-containing protein n=1 Tax=Antarcticibacterium arcticum TaxID=2585771 RepID=UPI00196AE030|nr:hemerythrin domain-containing protein [Antarcticibacterium arcticum]
MPSPIKRHESLKHLSRDHHHGLLLCWKIREGLKKEIDPVRIRDYCRFFYAAQLVPHFEFEEEEVFSLLDQHHPLIKQALMEHRDLTALFQSEEAPVTVLKEIEQLLEAHIRFEERVLFNEIQQNSTEEVLAGVEKKENDLVTPNPDDWEDKFWLK